MQLELTCDVSLVTTAILPFKCSFSVEISSDFPMFAAYTIYVSWVIHCSLLSPDFPHLFPLKNIFIERFRRARASAPRLRQRSWRLRCQKAQPWCLEKTEMKPAIGDFPWADWCHWWSMTFFQFKIRIWKHGEHGDLVWHFPQRCDESISFWTCPWYVFTFLIAHSISHIRWPWISMDALIHVFPGLFHLVGSIPKPSQLQHLHISWPNLQFHLVNSPFSVGSLLFFWRWTPHFNCWHLNFSWWSPQFLGISPHYRACGGASWKTNGQNSAWWEMDQKLTGKIMGRWAE